MNFKLTKHFYAYFVASHLSDICMYIHLLLEDTACIVRGSNDSLIEIEM